MELEQRFTAAEAEREVRLDKFLADAQRDLSRSAIQQLIDDGRVTVNGRAARASLRLRPGDAIVLKLPPPRDARLEPEEIALHVLHEDADLVVIEKPPGLVVHPGAGISRGTLAHALLHHYPEIADVGGEGRTVTPRPPHASSATAGSTRATSAGWTATASCTFRADGRT